MKAYNGLSEVDFIELETMGPLNTWLRDCADLIDAHWYADDLEKQGIPGGATPVMWAMGGFHSAPFLYR